jgi:hypothetical protein
MPTEPWMFDKFLPDVDDLDAATSACNGHASQMGSAEEVYAFRAGFFRGARWMQVKAKLAELQQAIDFHPRAWKLMLKRKPFLVVAKDEPYFEEVYLLIRGNEIKNGRWSDEDQQAFLRSIDIPF